MRSLDLQKSETWKKKEGAEVRELVSRWRRALSVLIFTARSESFSGKTSMLLLTTCAAELQSLLLPSRRHNWPYDSSRVVAFAKIS